MGKNQETLFNSKLSSLPRNPNELEEWLKNREDSLDDLKKNNRAGIVWRDSYNKKSTKYSLVYLHGFTAGPEEGYPVHKNVAQKLGMNLFKGRLPAHGRKHVDAMAHLTSEEMIESAVESLAIGQRLGNKVILMGTSTGGSLALYLAAHYSNIAGLVLYSPLIDFSDLHTKMLTKSWGRRATKYFLKGRYLSKKKTENTEEHRIWNQTYRVEGTIALGTLVKVTMTRKTFREIKQPIFLGYYYKDRDSQDDTVSVEAIHDMFRQIKTANSQKRRIAYPNAGSHVICSDVTSNSYREVEKETIEFLKDVLKN